MTTILANNQTSSLIDEAGVLGDGATDDTAALIDSNFTLHSKIYMGDGLYKMNKWMDSSWMVGNGYSTQLQPFSSTTNDGFVLSLGASSLPFGNFDTRTVRDLAIDGLTKGCIRFDDEVDVDAADLNSVSWLLDNLILQAREGASTGSKCVQAEFGTIGNIFNNVSIYGCGYGYWLQNNQFDLQHTGANTWNTNHMQRAEFAAVYINDSGAGRGNHVLNSCIIENNHGFGIFAKSDQSFISTGPLTLNNVWFEHNGLEATPLIPNHTVEIDSVTYTPKDMRFENFGSIVLNGVHVKAMDVLHSDVACYNSQHGGDQFPQFFSVTKDKNSTITLTNPSGPNLFGAVDEWSHTAPATTADYASNRMPMLRMEHRSVKAIATRRTSVAQGLEKTVSGNYTFGVGMSGVQVSDGILFDTCLETTTTVSQTTGSAIINETSASVGGLGGLTTPTVTAITQANPAVVSATAHGYVDNQLVSLTGVVGMTQLNDREYYINKIDNDSFSLRGEDSTGHTAYSSGGTFAGISSYAVMTVAAKVMSGLDNITDVRWSNNIDGNVGRIRTGALEEWVTTVCLVKMSSTGVGFPAARVMVRTNAGGSAVIRFCDYQVAAFPTKQEASDFIHSGVFEYSDGEDLLTTPDTVTDTAACSLTTEQSNLVTTGAAAPTLADGFEGQVKTIYHKTFAGAATITPANMHGGTSVATSAAGQVVEFKFTDSKWALIGNPYGLTIA